MQAVREVMARVNKVRRYARAYVSSFVGAARANGRFQEVERFCMFVGHPRSGGTLIGALLNAHPNLVIGHEVDVLGYLRMRFSRRQLYTLIMEGDRKFAALDNVWMGYDYSVPGQWQGRVERLRVIGNKRATASSLWLRQEPELLDRLRRMVGVGVFIIHVVRNPYDTIVTMQKHRLRRGEQEPFSKVIESYFTLCEGVANAREHAEPDHFRTVRHEDFVADPKRILRELCLFLQVEPTEEYLDACAGIVFESPKQRRHDVTWSAEDRQRVEEGIRRFDFLSGYSYDS